MRKRDRASTRATKESIPYCLGETAIFYCISTAPALSLLPSTQEGARALSYLHTQAHTHAHSVGKGDTVSTWKIWNAPMYFLFLARSGKESRTSPEVTTDLGTRLFARGCSFRVFARNDILSNLFLALRNGIRNAILNIYSFLFPERIRIKRVGKMNFPRVDYFYFVTSKRQQLSR